MTNPVSKFSQIQPSGVAPALSDYVMGLTGGTADRLYTLQQVRSTIATAGGVTGSVQFNSAGLFSGDSGFVYSGNGQATLALGAITTNLTALNITATWNNAAVKFDAPLLMNITNTASAAGSVFADFQIGGSSVFAIDKAANILVGGSTTSISVGGTNQLDYGLTTSGVWTFGSAVKLPAGTASVAPIKLTSGANLTTAAAGAVEFDGTCFYATAQASSRQVVVAEQVITLTSAYTLTSQTAAQQLFNATTNGALTVEASTTYAFECYFSLSSLSATSGSFGFAFGGSATLTAQAWWAWANKVATLATATAEQTSFNTAANTTLATANTNTAAYAMIRGKIRVNAAGTLIPQVSLGVAAAAIVGVDSFFRIWPLGTGSVTNVGDWS